MVLRLTRAPPAAPILQVFLVFLFSHAAHALRVNVGGPGFSAVVADSTKYSGLTQGATYTWGKSTNNVYLTHRYTLGQRPLIYAFSVNKGVNVGVRLRFSELYKPNGVVGKRVMNVLIGDSTNRAKLTVVRKNLDIFKQVGLYWNFDVTHRFKSNTGVVVVRIEGVKENPMLSGIDVFANGGVRPYAAGSAPVPAPAPAPAPGTGANSFKPGTWRTLPTTGWVQQRHESCTVMLNGLVYLIGGRGIKPVQVLNPRTKVWTTKKKTPVELNHMQCVAANNRIYAVGAWYGPFPREKEHTAMWVYLPWSDAWVQEKNLPVSRRRGGGAAVVYKGNIYYAGGNKGGHGVHATTLPMTDKFNLATKKWTALPNMPIGRDHVLGAVMGNRFCLLGGRDGGVKHFWAANIQRVNCFDLAAQKWLNTKANLPVGRGGAAVGSLCDGKHLFVAGGEGQTAPGVGGQAYKRVDYYNVWTDKFVGTGYLVRGRHGTGVAQSCTCSGGTLKREIFIPSGSGGLGGGPELQSTEFWTQSTPVAC